MTTGKIVPSIEYALTVTLNPKLYRFKPSEQYRLTQLGLDQMFEKTEWKISIIPEVTQNYNIHYHCIVSAYNIKKYKKGVVYSIHNKFRKMKHLYGYIYLKPITEFHIWQEYMVKDIEKTKQIIDMLPESNFERNDFEVDNLVGRVREEEKLC